MNNIQSSLSLLEERERKTDDINTIGITLRGFAVVMFFIIPGSRYNFSIKRYKSIASLFYEMQVFLYEEKG